MENLSVEGSSRSLRVRFFMVGINFTTGKTFEIRRNFWNISIKSLKFENYWKFLENNANFPRKISFLHVRCGENKNFKSNICILRQDFGWGLISRMLDKISFFCKMVKFSELFNKILISNEIAMHSQKEKNNFS